jgi:hypothetical protein
MSKYNAVPVDVDGYHFDSKAEHRRYQELRLLAHFGDIEELQVHKKYTVWQSGKEKIQYEADFVYQENGRVIAEDVKGVQTAVFRMKAKMFRAMYPDIELRIVEA